MSDQGVTLGQISAIHASLNKVGLMDEKRHMIGMFTDGRTQSTKEMTKAEAAELIRYLSKHNPRAGAEDKMRKKILSMAHEMGWHIPDTHKISMARVNEWCVNYGYLHKRLDAYNYAELPKLVGQFETVYVKFLKEL